MEKLMKALDDLATRFENASITYAEGNGITRNEDWFILKMQEELGELTQVWMKLTARGRKRGRTDEDLALDLADETADLLGHILLFGETISILRLPSPANGGLTRAIFESSLPLCANSYQQVEHVFFELCNRTWMQPEKCKAIVEFYFT